jgi:hypothetical protein
MFPAIVGSTNVFDKRKRRWQAVLEDDPLAGLINLFDLWMVFSIALLLALVSNMQQSGRVFRDIAAPGSNVADSIEKRLERVDPAAQRLERFRPGSDELTGEGERLGTAYRLKSGEVVYVPESKQVR